MLLDLCFLVLLSSYGFAVLLLDVSELVLVELAFSCRFQFHIVDLCLVVLVLLFDVFFFEVCVSLNRHDGLFVALLCALDVFSQLSDLVFSVFHLLAVLLLLGIDLVFVFLATLREGLLEGSFFRLLCLLQLLICRRIRKHLLRLLASLLLVNLRMHIL